jgi:hypothetical protein
MQIYCASTLFEGKTGDISVSALFFFKFFFSLFHLHTSIFYICFILLFKELKCLVEHLGKIKLCGERSDEIRSESRGNNSEDKIIKEICFI